MLDLSDLSFMTLVILQTSIIDLLLLNVAARSGNYEPFKKIVRGVVLALLEW
jgi:hypothetical protein